VSFSVRDNSFPSSELPASGIHNDGKDLKVGQIVVGFESEPSHSVFKWNSVLNATRARQTTYV